MSIEAERCCGVRLRCRVSLGRERNYRHGLPGRPHDNGRAEVPAASERRRVGVRGWERLGARPLDGKIARVDPSKGQLGPSFLASGDLHGMAVGGGYLWVTDASTNGIQRISEDLGSPPTRMPVGQVGGRPESVAYDDGAILVGFTGGTLAKINPSNPSSPATIWTQEVGFIDNGRPEHRVDGWRSARSSGSAVTALKRCDEELTPGETRSPELFPMSLGALPRAWAFRGHLLLNQRLGGEVTQLSESFDGTRRPRRIRRT